MKLTEKLIAIQAQLKAPKDKTNNFGGYKYRSCESILEAVKPLLQAQGCILTISDEIVESGNRIYVKAKATRPTARANTPRSVSPGSRRARRAWTNRR